MKIRGYCYMDEKYSERKRAKGVGGWGEARVQDGCRERATPLRGLHTPSCTLLSQLLVAVFREVLN